MNFVSLKNQKQFDLVNRRGVKISGEYFLLILAKQPALSITEQSMSVVFGMKVSKKLSKKAYIRNKIKRRIRHLIRLISTEVDMKGKAMIFIPYKGFELVKFEKLLAELKRVLSRNAN